VANLGAAFSRDRSPLQCHFTRWRWNLRWYRFHPFLAHLTYYRQARIVQRLPTSGTKQNRRRYLWFLATIFSWDKLESRTCEIHFGLVDEQYRFHDHLQAQIARRRRAFGGRLDPTAILSPKFGMQKMRFNESPDSFIQSSFFKSLDACFAYRKSRKLLWRANFRIFRALQKLRKSDSRAHYCTYWLW